MATILITGGHGGIGLECAKRLAADSYDLLLAGRSPEPMSVAAAALRADYGVQVKTVDMDTSSLASIRRAARHCLKLLDSGEINTLQAILCNAGGIFHGPVSYSPEEYEHTFAANYLGHFLLVELLIARLSESGRVVFTASGTHDPDTFDGKSVGAAVEPDAFALANDGKDGRKPLSPGKRYTTSKLCMVLQAYELDRRLRRHGSKIASIAFDPGAVLGTSFLRSLPKPAQWLAGSAFGAWLLKRLGTTMGDLSLSGASLAELAVSSKYASGSGKYYQVKDGAFSTKRSAVMSYDEARATKLWNDSKRLVALQPEEECSFLR